MMKTLLTTVALFLTTSVHAVDEKFFNALHQIESSGRTGKVIGDNGRALGPLQIHKPYFRDAAAFDKSLGTDYTKVQDLDFAKKVVIAYLKRYAPDAVKKNDYQTLARIHNGGPQGHKNPATVKYWQKVKPMIYSVTFRRYNYSQIPVEWEEITVSIDFPKVTDENLEEFENTLWNK